MNNVRGSRPPTDEVRGGTAMPRTCTQPIPSLGSTAWGWFRCWIHSGVSRWFHEPPDAEPHVRWCGRTAGVIPPPTRLEEEVRRPSAERVARVTAAARREWEAETAGRGPFRMHFGGAWVTR